MVEKWSGDLINMAILGDGGQVPQPFFQDRSECLASIRKGQKWGGGRRENMGS